MRRVAVLAALVAAPAAAYDANGVALGSPESRVTEAFPSAACQPLQWASEAANRRCDGRASVGGVNGRITFYLKDDKVQAFDLRFDPTDAERLSAFFKKRFGPPASEAREKLETRRGGELYKVRWEKAGERAVLTAQRDKRRGFFTVSRGEFEDEIYRR